ncbi:hypothetical protein QTP70_017559 [Hemibagrus guttatus]|uniref:ribonuclease H n=1 Tax=Hemibagrus guttatus TaxID=175788 RepID=A0AAE0UYC8_9TELE|nr:hypothetical protein QTP70_017559 [Hemibagrus guttatus]
MVRRGLHCVFVDLEKAYDRVPREELWYCMRKSGVAEKYVRVVQDMYERSRTVVRCAVGQREEFNVEVGLHQGSALSPFLFAIVMDQLSEEVRQESPWTMMFADDIVICSESREQVEENLERWRFALERRGMKVSRSKTEYMCVNEREGSGTVRLQGEEVKKVQEFKYLGSTVQSNGECGKEVKKRVQAGWNGWRKVSGVLCDQKISARIKGKVYRTVVRPAMLYGLETVSLRKRQESELEVAELKMLRFSLGVTRLDRIRNEYIRGTAHVGHLGDKVREARLRWFGHVQRRETPAVLQRWLERRKPRRRTLTVCEKGGIVALRVIASVTPADKTEDQCVFAASLRNTGCQRQLYRDKTTCSCSTQENLDCTPGTEPSEPAVLKMLTGNLEPIPGDYRHKAGESGSHCKAAWKSSRTPDACCHPDVKTDIISKATSMHPDVPYMLRKDTNLYHILLLTWKHIIANITDKPQSLQLFTTLPHKPFSQEEGGREGQGGGGEEESEEEEEGGGGG